MKTCPVLECKISSYNKQIKCQYCDFFSCTKCFEKFINDKYTTQCMSCNKTWTEEYIDEIFSKSFKKKLQKKENIIDYDREIAMMPETMVIIENEKKQDKIRSKIFLLKKEIANLESEIYELNIRQKVVKDEVVKVIKQCPNKKCNGYLNNKYICGICDTQLCLKCEKINNNDHICNKEDIDTVLLKKKECKNCPTCSNETFKDGGCYLVWCPPPCNGGKGTAWNFNTGKIEEGPIHTPLYYEYMIKNGLNNNNALINNCVDRNYLPNIWFLGEMVKKDFELNNKFILIYEIHRKVNEFKTLYMSSRKYKPLEIIKPFNNNMDLRLKFLKGEIDEKNFKKNLLLRKNRHNKKRKIYENLEMLYNVCYDIFEKLSFSKLENLNKNIDDAKNELEAVRKYYNKSIEKTKKILGCESLDVSNLNNTWTFTY